MRPLLSLPDELLHASIEYIAYTPVIPGDSYLIPKSELTRSSVDLLALSVVNRRLRRVCLSFLFARIRIRSNNAEKLDKNLALFSRFTKILVIDQRSLQYSPEDQIIIQALPQLKHLLHVELHHYGTGLLRTVLAHPTVTSVVVSELPDRSMHKQDLSKMILNYHTPRESGRSPDYERCLRHGMRLTRLMLRKPELLDTDFRLGVFPGLEAIEFYLRSFPVSFSWLPILSSNHPTLNQLWLLDQSRFFNLHTPPFISSFDEEAVRQDLKKGFDVKRVGLRRDIGQSSREWYVMAITLTSTSATTSLIQILTLVASSFPKLEILTLNLDLHQGSYSVGDLVSVFTQFSSLRDLFICDLYKRLDFDTGDVFGNDGFMSSPPAVDTSDLGAHYQCDETITHAASEILRLTSLLTKQVRNLDFLFFEDDMTPENEKSPHMYVGFGKRRYLKGLLPVHTSNRDVEAIFQLIKYRTAIH